MISDKHIFIKELKKSKAVEKVFEVPFDAMFNKRQKRNSIDARTVVGVLLMSKYHENAAAVAKYFGVHRTTPYDWIDRIENLDTTIRPGVIQELANHIDGQSYCMNQCYSCVHRASVPGDAHIQCMKFQDILGENAFTVAAHPNRVDGVPKGDPHGIRSGWFVFPFNYDPTWMRSECKFYKHG